MEIVGLTHLSRFAWAGFVLGVMLALPATLGSFARYASLYDPSNPLPIGQMPIQRNGRRTLL